MKAHKQAFGIERMCRVFQVCRSGYYRWLRAGKSARALENEELLSLIREIYEQSKGRYGSPKIHDQLFKRGYKVSVNRVARLMQVAGIKSIVHRKVFRACSTDSTHDHPICENVLDRDFSPSAPAKVWVSDISYIPTEEGWLYLTIIMDLFDRKIIGWALSEGLSTEETTLPAFKMACTNREVEEGLIFHSDRGIQYAAKAFRDILPQEVIQSMSRKANCWDNALAENFFNILKKELVYHTRFVDKQTAKRELFYFIEIWYNRQRTYSTLGYMTPHEFGQHFYQLCA
ncbi:MAG: IS3 family transposase [Bacteroidota bacterium]